MANLSIYFAGLISFFSPCILPIIPVYFYVLSGSNNKLLVRALLFCFGFTLVFSLMGAGAGFLGTVLQDHRVMLSLVAGMALTLIGLKLLGIIQIPFIEKVGSINSNRFIGSFSLLNALLLGILFAITWSPCIGLILGSILTYISSSGHSYTDGAFKLFIYGVGISTPLIISVFFYKKLNSFYKNNFYFFGLVNKILGVLIIIFAFSIFNRVVTISKVNQRNISVPDKIMLPNKLPLFISFTHPNCEECKSNKKVIEDLEKTCGGKIIDFRVVDTSNSDYEYLVYQQGIFSFPTYILLNHQGKEITRLIGSQDLKTINTEIFKLTGYECNVH